MAAAFEAALYRVGCGTHVRGDEEAGHAMYTHRQTPNVQRHRRLCLQGDATTDVHFLTIVCMQDDPYKLLLRVGFSMNSLVAYVLDCGGCYGLLCRPECTGSSM